MSLKIKRDLFERIVLDELAKYLRAQALNEAPPGRGTVLDDEIPDPEEAPEEPLPTDSPAPEAGDQDSGDAEAPEELPAGEEPTDDELDADLEDAESNAEEGTVAADLEGKTIESIALEEDSKIMPGAMEVVVTFRESDDALRLLITKTGRVKIFYKGLHNGFDSPVEQIPGEEPEMDLGAEEEPEGEEDLEEVPPLGPEDMPPESEEPGSEEEI